MNRIGKTWRQCPNGYDWDSWTAGIDYVLNGSTKENCHCQLFTTPLKSKSWEAGAGRALDVKELVGDLAGDD